MRWICPAGGRGWPTPSAFWRRAPRPPRLLPPALLLLPTITAGGDTPCHYPTAVWFNEHLLPSLRLHGWYPGAYLGHPLLLYYFPLPFLVMSALAPFFGMPVAFKLGHGPAASSCCRRSPTRRSGSWASAFPPRCWARRPPPSSSSSRRTRSGAAPSRARSTGEFSYTYGIGLAVALPRLWLPALCARRAPLGFPARASSASRRSPTATRCSGPGSRPSYFLYAARRPRRGALGPGCSRVGRRWPSAARRVLAAAAARRLGLDDAVRRPLDHGDDPRTSCRRFLWPLFALAVLGAGRDRSCSRAAPAAPTTGCCSSRTPRSWARPWRAAGPALGIDRRALRALRPARALRWLGGATLGPGRSRLLPAPDLAALGLVLVGPASTATPARAWSATGSTGTTPGSRPRSCGRRSASWPAALAGARRPTRGWPSSTRRCTSKAGLHPHVRDAAVLLAAAPRSRASTTRRACRPTPSTTWPRSWTRARPTRSRAASTRSFDTDNAAAATCASST